MRSVVFTSAQLGTGNGCSLSKVPIQFQPSGRQPFCDRKLFQERRPLEPQALTPTLERHLAGRRFGDARVSPDDQDLSLQIDALVRCGIPKQNILMDKISGAKSDRPGLGNCMQIIEPGDILVVWRLDRLRRSIGGLITMVEDLRQRGVGFRSLSEGAGDTTSAWRELIFNIFSAPAPFERRLIQERTKASLDWRQPEPVAEWEAVRKQFPKTPRSDWRKL